MKRAGPPPFQLPAPGLQHPGRWLWIVLALPILLGIARLKFDVEVFGLLPSDIPTVKGLILYQEHFAPARELILTLEGENPEQTEEAARCIAEQLRNHPELVETATWQPPWLEHPEYQLSS